VDVCPRQDQLIVLERRIAQAIAECPKWLALEVTIGPPSHRIVLEVRQLADILVESDWQPTRRIDLPTQSRRDRGAALLTGIPSLENRISMLLLPCHTQRAAVGQHYDERLTGRRNRMQQFLLRGRHRETRTISARETRLINGHLLALEAAGNANYGNYHIGLLRRRDCGRIGTIDGWRPDHPCLR